MGTDSTVVMREVRKKLRSKIVLSIISPINDEIDKRYNDTPTTSENLGVSKHHLQIGGSNASLGFAIKCVCDDPVSFYLKKTTLDSPSKLHEFKKTILRHVGIEFLESDQMMQDQGQGGYYSPVRSYQLPSINELLPTVKKEETSPPTTQQSLQLLPNSNQIDSYMLQRLDGVSVDAFNQMIPHLSSFLELLEKSDIIPTMLSPGQIHELARIILKESEIEKQRNMVFDSP